MDARLAALAQLVPAGCRLADIGTDHAYLPIALVKAGKVPFAIASDIAPGPLANARADVAAAGLDQQIDLRLGSGLSTVRPVDQIDTVVIAGVGGHLIQQILQASSLRFSTLVLEPNIGEPGVRRWLMDHCYQIVAERLLWVKGHAYELIKAQAGRRVHFLTPRQLLFGPKILQVKGPVFVRKWTGQLAYDQKLLRHLQAARQPDLDKIAHLRSQIALIKGELNDQS